MQKQANDITNRLICLGIGVIILALIKFIFPDSLMKLPSYFPLFSFVGIVSLVLGLRYKKKLQEKDKVLGESSPQEEYVSHQYKWLYFLGILMALIAGFSSHFREQADYILGILLVIYGFWFYKEVNTLDKYLNRK